MAQFIRVALAAACSVAAIAAQATTVTLQYTGVVDSSSGELEVPVGTTISGQVSYNTNALSNCQNEGSCVYNRGVSQQLEYASPDPVQLKVGMASAIVSTKFMDFPGATGFYFGGAQLNVSGLYLDGRGPDNGYPGSISLMLAGSQFKDLTLPDRLDLSQFDVSHTGSVYLNYDIYGDGLIYHMSGDMAFHLTSLTTVPEPSMAWLSGLGLMGLLAGVRRQQRKTLPST